MMKRKKAARNKFSKFESIPILLAMLHRVVFASFSRSSEKKEFCRPCSCRRLVKILPVGLKSCLTFIGEVFCPYLPTFEGVFHCIEAPGPQFSQELAAIDGLHELGSLLTDRPMRVVTAPYARAANYAVCLRAPSNEKSRSSGTDLKSVFPTLL